MQNEKELFLWVHLAIEEWLMRLVLKAYNREIGVKAILPGQLQFSNIQRWCILNGIFLISLASQEGSRRWRRKEICAKEKSKRAKSVGLKDIPESL